MIVGSGNVGDDGDATRTVRCVGDPGAPATWMTEGAPGEVGIGYPNSALAGVPTRIVLDLCGSCT